MLSEPEGIATQLNISPQSLFVVPTAGAVSLDLLHVGICNQTVKSLGPELIPCDFYCDQPIESNIDVKDHQYRTCHMNLDWLYWRKDCLISCPEGRHALIFNSIELQRQTTGNKQ